MKRLAALSLLAVALIGGCAGRNTTYSCPGYPSQPLCLPVSEVYRLSDGAGPPPASTPRPSLIETEKGIAAGSGWVWSKRIWN